MSNIHYNEEVLYSLEKQIDKAFNTSSSSSIDILKLNDKDIQRLSRILKLYMSLNSLQRDIIAVKITHPEFTGQQIADSVGCLRREIYRNYKKIAEFEDLAFLTPYKYINEKEGEEEYYEDEDISKSTEE